MMSVLEAGLEVLLFFLLILQLAQGLCPMLSCSMIWHLCQLHGRPRCDQCLGTISSKKEVTAGHHSPFKFVDYLVAITSSSVFSSNNAGDDAKLALIIFIREIHHPINSSPAYIWWKEMSFTWLMVQPP
jgi:hypothetical protein